MEREKLAKSNEERRECRGVEKSERKWSKSKDRNDCMKVIKERVSREK